jgi:SWIM zinc finger
VAVTQEQVYRYLAPSTLSGRDLRLQTSGGPSEETRAQDGHPRFFQGFLAQPEPAALGLLAVAEVARTRYFQPTRPAGLDPVVTGSRDRLRFESLSGCAGVYARLDILPEGLDGELCGHGTTNVDIGPTMYRALSRLAGLDPLHLRVGPDELEVSTMDDTVVERRVALPRRWVSAFAQVQAIAAGCDLRAEVNAAEAITFLHRLPVGPYQTLWVVPAGRSLRLTTHPVPGAVCLAAPQRLVALRPLLRLASTLRVYGPVGVERGPTTSVWEVQAGPLRLVLALSPHISRGFSGEGALLAGLSDDVAAAGGAERDDALRVGSLLGWEPTVEVQALVERAGIDADRVRSALRQLAAAGQVGYDLSEAAFFHRVLPYDADRAARDNPRLVAARALVDAGMVAIEAGVVRVTSGEETYRVRMVDGEWHCACPWWATYRGGRGPCKHVLAARMVTASIVEKVR